MDSVEQTVRMNNLSKELRKYGFAQSSQDAIAQASTIYGGPEVTSENAELMQLTKAQVSEIVSKMQKLWVFKEASDQKVSVVADQLVKVTDKLNEIIKSISMVEMNQAVFDKKLNVLKEKMGSSNISESREAASQNSSSRVQERVEESSPQQREKEKKLDRPIDRNGVAPDSVSIEKMFYFGNKR